MTRRPQLYESVATLRNDPKLVQIFDSPVAATVVFPVSHPVGLSVIRTLEDYDVPILAVDFKPHSAGLYSNRVVPLLMPHLYDDAETFTERLLAIGANFRTKPVLFLVDDEDLYLSLRREADFARVYRLPLSSWRVVEPIVDKGKLYRNLQDHGYPVPKTWFAETLDELDAQRGLLDYPCIVKPTYSTAFRQRYGVKAKRFDDFPPLREFVASLFEEGIDCVVQRFISGSVEKLYTFAAYSDDRGEVIASFTGRKLHQFPPDFGTCRLGESVEDERLERHGRELLKILRYRGISLSEFKRDPSGEYLLLELNPRPGGWPERLSQLCGANLMLTAYKETLGERVASHRITRFGVKWANVAEDFYYCVRGYRLLGYPEAHRGLLGWLSDLKGLETGAFFSWHDPMPAWMRFKGMCAEFYRREQSLRGRT